MHLLSLIFSLVLLNFERLNAFYFPGIAPKVYCKSDTESDTCQSHLPVYVNRLDSVDSILPFEYRHFDFCSAESIDKAPSENLGQLVFGDRISPSPYKLSFLKDEQCVEVCEKKYKTSNTEDFKKLRFLIKTIALNYQHHWIIDNLPVAWCYINELKAEFCSRGFPIGCYVTMAGEKRGACKIFDDFNVKNSFYLFNHVEFLIEYHSTETDEEEWNTGFLNEGGRIVRAKAILKSLNYDKVQNCNDVSNENPIFIPADFGTQESFNVKYTYSVKFVKNNEIKWASRWDYLLESKSDVKIQWFSILNSLVIVLFLSGMIATILFRAIRKDFAKYNGDNDEEVEEEIGWKSIHADVFRSPKNGLLLSVFVGNGVQIAIMSLITLLVACLGLLSPSSRGALMTAAIVLYALVGTPSGYLSARLYKMFNGDKWVKNILLTAFLCPGIVFVIFFALNLILWINSSSAAMPFLTLLALLALWICVSAPLVFLGSYLGFKQASIENPVRTNQIPRQVPEQSFYNRSLIGIIIGGILPFGCIFIQLFFILNSIWAHQFYYMFGFLTIVYLILIITCSETTILLCYFHLCTENYNWWWRSFLTSGFAALYFFIYSIQYFVTKLEITELTSTFLYFGYSFMMSFLFFIFTGSIGFLACYLFIRKIYSVIKID